MTDSSRHVVCTRRELPVGRARRLDVDGVWISVWNVDGRFYAVGDRCPHQGASLARGAVADGKIVCAWHGLRYDPETGREIVLERLATPTYTVELDGDEIVLVTSGADSES